jgi:hypothetical protein
VYIDQGGQFFTATGNLSIYHGSNTMIPASTRNALTVLHELMHWNGNRSDDAGHNATFNQKIYDNCIKDNPYYSADSAQEPPGASA